LRSLESTELRPDCPLSQEHLIDLEAAFGKFGNWLPDPDLTIERRK
jgi:hypothetical protein